VPRLSRSFSVLPLHHQASRFSVLPSLDWSSLSCRCFCGPCHRFFDMRRFFFLRSGRQFLIRPPPPMLFFPVATSGDGMTFFVPICHARLCSGYDDRYGASPPVPPSSFRHPSVGQSALLAGVPSFYLPGPPSFAAQTPTGFPGEAFFRPLSLLLLLFGSCPRHFRASCAAAGGLLFFPFPEKKPGC